MELRQFFDASRVNLDLEAESKDEILRELVALLGVDDDKAAALLGMLRQREELGSTGIGKGIAIPHCRSPLVDSIRIAFGRKKSGIDYDAADKMPVYNFFLIVAPPIEINNQYLPVLGRLAQFSKLEGISDRLRAARTPDELIDLIAQHG